MHHAAGKDGQAGLLMGDGLAYRIQLGVRGVADEDLLVNLQHRSRRNLLGSQTFFWELQGVHVAFTGVSFI